MKRYGENSAESKKSGLPTMMLMFLFLLLFFEVSSSLITGRVYKISVGIIDPIELNIERRVNPKPHTGGAPKSKIPKFFLSGIGRFLGINVNKEKRKKTKSFFSLLV
jgi:hypothetical protein